MEVVEFKEFTLLPPPSHLCQVCAVDHEEDQPHNAQSLFYQTQFNMQNGRAATWEDAMVHCSDEVKAAWNEQLDQMEENGIEVKNRWISEVT